MENMYALCGSNNKALARFPGEGHGSNKYKRDYWSHVRAFIVLVMNSERDNTPLDPFLHIPHIELPGTSSPIIEAHRSLPIVVNSSSDHSDFEKLEISTAEELSLTGLGIWSMEIFTKELEVEDDGGEAFLIQALGQSPAFQREYATDLVSSISLIRAHMTHGGINTILGTLDILQQAMNQLDFTPLSEENYPLVSGNLDGEIDAQELQRYLTKVSRVSIKVISLDLGGKWLREDVLYGLIHEDPPLCDVFVFL